MNRDSQEPITWDSAAVRELACGQGGLGSIPARCPMWVEFVFGSRLAPKTKIEDPHGPAWTRMDPYGPA